MASRARAAAPAAIGRVALIGCALLVLGSAPAGAHAVGVSRGDYTAAGSDVRSDLVLARGELVASLPGLDADRDGRLATEEIERGRALLFDWATRGIAIRVPEGPCVGRLESAALAEQDGVELHLVHRCPARVEAFSVELALLADLSLGHRHLATVASSARSARGVLYEAQPKLDLDGVGASADSNAAAPPPSNAATALSPSATAPEATSAFAGVARPLSRLGVEHILTGYDHLLFLLALVLVGGPLRSLLRVVTAFTIAHSITLAIAVLGVWTPPAAIVEPAIAGSIAYVGIENFLVRDLGRRWRLTFLFGLLHGFGFAGALREIELPARQLPLALASFNVGVEAGQLAVLAVVLPVVTWLARRDWFARRGVYATSAAISAAGIWWLAVRIYAP